jgi:hypothetical protein
MRVGNVIALALSGVILGWVARGYVDGAKFAANPQQDQQQFESSQESDLPTSQSSSEPTPSEAQETARPDSPLSRSTNPPRKLPTLIQNTSYEKVRQTLIDSGWQAQVASPLRKEEVQAGLQKWFVQKGFYEVESCLPTGLGTCKSIFHDENGNKLAVFSVNGTLGGKVPVLVISWKFE